MGRSIVFAFVFFLLFSLEPASAEDGWTDRASGMLGTIYTGQTPGAAVVVSRGGEVVFDRAFGMADLELGVPMDERHVFRLASLTKQYSAAAMLALVEDGRVALDDPISKFLPDFPVGEVTVHQLLNHTSGIKSYTSIEGYMTSERVRQDLATAELVAVFADEPVDFAPGERWAYNNSGYVLVGAIIEAVTGKPWNDFIRERLLTPHGIEATDAYADAAIVPGRVEGYDGPADRPGRAPFLSMTQPHAAGGLMATAADVDRWQRGLHGGEMLSEAMYARMVTPEGAAVGAEDGPNYGYGIGVEDWFGQRVLSHGGGIFGFSTYAMYLPAEALSIVVLTNRIGPGWSPEDIALRVAGLATDRAYPVEEPALEWDEEQLVSLEGTYRIGEDAFRTLRLDDGVLISQRNGERDFRVYPVKGDRLAFENSLNWFSIERDEAGEVAALELHFRRGGEAERAEKVSDEVRTRQAIEVPIEQLQRLVGRYELQPGFVIEARIADGGLEVQATGQPSIVMQAESATKFFSTQIGADIVFDVPDAGPATGLTLHQGGRQMPAPRIEAQVGEQ